MDPTPRPQPSRGFIYGAAAVVVVLIALGSGVGSMIRSQEERAFNAVVDGAAGDAARLLEHAVVSLGNDGQALLDGRDPSSSKLYDGIVVWPGGEESRAIGRPSGLEMSLEFGAVRQSGGGWIIETDTGVYRLFAAIDDAVVATDLNLDTFVAALDEASAGLAKVALTRPRDGRHLAGSTPEGGDFERVRQISLLGSTLYMHVSPGPNWLISAETAALLLFAVLGLTAAGLLLVLGRRSAVRVAAAQRRIQITEELAEGKDRFLASVSHELRTPLAAIQGFAMELRDGVFDPGERMELVRIIAQQSNDMGLLVEDLLVAGRVDAGTITVDQVPMDLIGPVRETLAVITVPRPKRVSLSIEPQWAIGDAFRVRQIVRNLLTNALRYGGNAIEIVVGGSQHEAYVEVVDDGQGINVEDPSVVFQPYHRLSDARTMPASVGLGLTVSRDLAELMGGSLTYLRRGGRTVFRLALAAAEAPPMPQQTQLVQVLRDPG